jgi:hypothetical protein
MIGNDSRTSFLISSMRLLNGPSSFGFSVGGAVGSASGRG